MKNKLKLLFTSLLFISFITLYISCNNEVNSPATEEQKSPAEALSEELEALQTYTPPTLETFANSEDPFKGNSYTDNWGKYVFGNDNTLTEYHYEGTPSQPVIYFKYKYSYDSTNKILYLNTTHGRYGNDGSLKSYSEFVEYVSINNKMEDWADSGYFEDEDAFNEYLLETIKYTKKEFEEIITWKAEEVTELEVVGPQENNVTKLKLSKICYIGTTTLSAVVNSSDYDRLYLSANPNCISIQACFCSKKYNRSWIGFTQNSQYIYFSIPKDSITTTSFEANELELPQNDSSPDSMYATIKDPGKTLKINYTPITENNNTLTTTISTSDSETTEYLSSLGITLPLELSTDKSYNTYTKVN